MSLERKDVRAKLDSTMHAALAVLADVDGIDIAEFVEREIVRVIGRRVHEASVIATQMARLGLTGSGRESAGTTGNRREWPGTSGSDRE